MTLCKDNLGRPCNTPSACSELDLCSNREQEVITFQSYAAMAEFQKASLRASQTVREAYNMGYRPLISQPKKPHVPWWARLLGAKQVDPEPVVLGDVVKFDDSGDPFDIIVHVSPTKEGQEFLKNVASGHVKEITLMQMGQLRVVNGGVQDYR